MNWYLQSSEDCDVVKSSRIRLARNLNGFKFNLENKSEIEQLENKIKDNLYSIGSVSYTHLTLPTTSRV